MATSGPATRPRGRRVEEYLDLTAAHDVGGARALVLSELEAGGDSLARVIGDLLVPAMAEVGARWYDGRWNPAQEHVACGITERALMAASVRARSHRPEAEAPTVVMGCPRGEAHVLPARFASELLIEAGMDVIVLGLPVPDEDLADYLMECRPTALALSCTDPLALVGVRDAVAAAHRVGFPVLVGGAGLGPDDRRGRAVGADGWAGGVDQAVAVLHRWRVRPPDLAVAPPEDREVAALRRLRASFIDDAFADLSRRVDPLRQYGDRQAEQVRGNLRMILASLFCALLSQDDRLFADFVRWSRGRDRAAGNHDAVTDESLAVINEALGPGFVGARRMLTDA